MWNQLTAHVANGQRVDEVGDLLMDKLAFQTEIENPGIKQPSSKMAPDAVTGKINSGVAQR